MEPFFAFAESYWWMIFPIFGLIMGFGGAWDKAARRRHRRRLEILKAKGELRAAQAQAQGTSLGVPTAAMAAPEASGDDITPGSQAAQVQRLFDAQDAVTARWLEYELDVAKLIAFPAMSDGRQPLTAAFLRAKRTADRARPDSAKARISREQFAEYREAVTDYEVAFDVAERDARRVRDSSFSAAERKRLDTAKQLLTVAIDHAATPAERQLAYRRVREELDGLISVSDDAIEILEEKVMLEISPRSASAAADAHDPALSDPTVADPLPAPVEPRSVRPAREPKTGPWPLPSPSAGGTPGRVVHPKRLP